MSLKGKTMFISGASRGIGLAIAKRAAADGANIALIAKTAEPHPKLEGTVYTAAKEIEEAGGQALPIVGDIRDGDSVTAAVGHRVEHAVAAHDGGHGRGAEPARRRRGDGTGAQTRGLLRRGLRSPDQTCA